VNNIIAFNSAENAAGGTNGGGLFVNGATPTVRFNDLYGNTPNNVAGTRTDSSYIGSSGNVSVDPKFGSRSAATLELHLLATSTLIDVGDNAEAPAQDLDGAPRSRTFRGSNSRIDRGPRLGI
jgi:hypothetical protein